MSNKKHTDSEIIVQRLLLATESRTKTELAEKLGYNSVSGLTNWKSRGVDWNKIIEKFPTLNVNYLKTGVGEIIEVRSQNAIDSVNFVREEAARYKEKELTPEDLPELVRLKKEIEERIQRLIK